MKPDGTTVPDDGPEVPVIPASSFLLCAASKAHASIYQRRLPRSRAQYIGQAHAFIPHVMMFWKPLLLIMCVFVRVHCLWHGRWTLEPGIKKTLSD